MALNNFPYTNLHSLNLDWILDKMKELIADFSEVETSFSGLSSQFEELKSYVNDYFDTLDLTDEVRTIINELIANGYIEQIVSEMVEEGYFRRIVDDVVKNPQVRPTQYNKQAVKEFIEVLETYLDNTNHLYYGNNGALNVNMSTEGGLYAIDCSTYNLLALNGVPYYKSRYSHPEGDRDSNVSTYAWGIDIYSGRTKNVSGVAEYYRYATDVCRWFWDNNLLYYPDTTFSNVKPGDLLFWINSDDIDNEDIDQVISGVHHCAVFLGIDSETGNIRYIDANQNRAQVIAINDVAISSRPEIKLAGAFPSPFNPSQDPEIRAKIYLGNNSAKSNTDYQRLSMTALGGATGFADHYQLSNGRLQFKEAGLYQISAQIKITTSSVFTQWRLVSWSASEVAQNIAEGSLGAFTDINGNAHNGYANISLTRYFDEGASIGFNTAGASTFMSGLIGTYIEVAKI